MDTWIFQGGYPLVRVGEDGSLSQTPFSYRGDPGGAIGSAWKVPVVSRSLQEGDPDPVPVLLDGTGGGAAGTGGNRLVNAGGSGFYRVSYPSATVERLAAGLGDLPPGDSSRLGPPLPAAPCWRLCRDVVSWRLPPGAIQPGLRCLGGGIVDRGPICRGGPAPPPFRAKGERVEWVVGRAFGKAARGGGGYRPSGPPGGDPCLVRPVGRRTRVGPTARRFGAHPVPSGLAAPGARDDRG